jgi:hypothetical protein
MRTQEEKLLEAKHKELKQLIIKLCPPDNGWTELALTDLRNALSMAKFAIRNTKGINTDG